MKEKINPSRQNGNFYTQMTIAKQAIKSRVGCIKRTIHIANSPVRAYLSLPTSLPPMHCLRYDSVDSPISSNTLRRMHPHRAEIEGRKTRPSLPWAPLLSMYSWTAKSRIQWTESSRKPSAAGLPRRKPLIARTRLARGVGTARNSGFHKVRILIWI
jgi:hypothetical protein